jgi:hypothetical protein
LFVQSFIQLIPPKNSYRWALEPDEVKLHWQFTHSSQFLSFPGTKKGGQSPAADDRTPF